MSDQTEPLDGEDLINFEDVTARITYLEARDCHRTDDASWCSDYECVTCDDSSKSELEALRTLAGDMAPASNYGGRASAIRDSYLETFVRDEADDLTGIEDTHLAGYVKWNELTADRRAEMTEITFRGTTYYVTS